MLQKPSKNPGQNSGQNTQASIFDENAIYHNRKRCLNNFGDHNFLFELAAENIADRLLDITHNFDHAVLNGCLRLPNRFYDLLSNNGDIKHLMKMDLFGADICGSEIALPFGQNSLDLFLSFLTMHTINDLPGALIQINYALKPDGLFLGTLFGGETLYELRLAMMQAEQDLKGGVHPRILPFADKQQMGALMQRAGFALPVIDSDIIEVTYPSLTKLYHDLRGMGEANTIKQRSRYNPGRAFFNRVEDIYKNNYTVDGQILARFEIIYLIGWAPHESQQKPMRPGSAQTSLAQALDTDENKSDVPTGF